MPVLCVLNSLDSGPYRGTSQEKHPPRRTPQYPYAWGSLVILAVVGSSYERGTLVGLLIPGTRRLS